MSATSPRFLRLSYFIWIVVPLAIYAAFRLVGLPHMIWSYTFQGSHGDPASRRYISCTFVGPYGPFTVNAVNGRCSWIAFRKADEASQ